jgi:PAS domain S-box-containing protein
MHPPLAPSARRFWPSPWASLLRDRLTYFRTLALVLALLTLWGLSLAFSFAPGATVSHAAAMGVGALLLTIFWVVGWRRGMFGLRWLPLEVAGLLLFIWGGRDEFGAFGLLYIGLQYRALFDGRRHALILASSYGAVYVGGYGLLPDGFAGMDPVVGVELMVGGFCAYLMHTLGEVLLRDQERKRALRESEQRFRSVIENLREALIITDLDDRIVLANPRVFDVLGYTQQELLGLRATDVFLPDGARSVFTSRQQERVQGKSDLYETLLLRKDRTLIHAEISASPYRDGSGTVIGTLGTISDISGRKRLEGRLRQGMRLEAVGQLAGGVAHDFNNLLTVIKCHTELLLADLPYGDSNRDSIVEIDKSADRGASLTQQLLAFSRKQLLQPQRLSLAALVANCADTLRGLVSPQVGIVIEHTGEDSIVHADPLQMEHVLVSLVRNANDAITGIGRIDIQTRLVRVADDQVPVPNQDMQSGDYVLLTVSDTGRGMSPDVIARLFEPFVTTKSPGAGSGLGLASVYGSVRQGGGFIAVESAPSAGTTFRIWLPVHRPGAAKHTPAPALQPA